MERNAVPGDGSKPGNWHTALARVNWKDDPFQTADWGTPGAPNSDIPACVADADCAAAFPGVVLGDCEHRACVAGSGTAWCTYANQADGATCGTLFCTVGQTCTAGACGGGGPRDCAGEDTSPTALCSDHTCDENGRTCVATPRTGLYEGPAGDPTCSDGIDNDCDGLTDAADPKCSFAIASVTPSQAPMTGGWTVTVAGGALNLVTDVQFGGVPAVQIIQVDTAHLGVTLPAAAAAGDVDVTIVDGAIKATLPGGLRYIGYVGGGNPPWGNTQSPVVAVSAQVGQPTDPIYGRVYLAGVTDATPPDPTKLAVDLGWGPVDTSVSQVDPYVSPDWKWAPATVNSACTDCGGNLEFMGTVTPDQAGAFAIAFRYSADGGLTWQYGDLTLTDGTGNVITDGSADGWQAANALPLNVN
jgi:hypothetical protein